MGECPLGTCFILQTNHPKVLLPALFSFLPTPEVKYLGYSAGYFAETPTNAYQSTWSALVAIYKHNQQVMKNKQASHTTSDTIISKVVTKG
jgi:hypothetical protein